MSATNWGTCFNCKQSITDEYNKKIEEIKKSYGKIPPDEYISKLKSIKKPDESEKLSLREDYEVYIDEDMEFHVHYHAFCEKCGFTFTYNHIEKMKKGGSLYKIKLSNARRRAGKLHPADKI